MKQFLLTFLSITAFCFNQFAQDGFKKPGGNNTNKTIVHRPHKSHNYNWNGSSWFFVDSTDYQYNVQGQVTNSISRNGNYTERIVSNYDNLFQPTLELRDVYDQASSTWKPANKHQIDYNGLQDIILDERYLFNNGNWELWLGTKNTYQYDNNNRISEIIEFAYNESTNVYRENIKFSDIVYDNNNNMIEQIRSTWNGTQFQYWEKDMKAYNVDNTIATHTVFVWNSNTSSWNTDYRMTYTYGANGSYVSLCEVYVLSNYVTSFRRIVEFDSFQNLTRDVVESWDDVNSTWLTGQNQDLTNIYTYNQNGYMTQEINRYMDLSDTIYYKRKDYYNFQTFDSQVGVHTNEEEKISIYPNPMETTSVIDLSKLQEKVKSVTVYNAAGMQILSILAIENHKVILTNEQLKSGLYLIIIETDSRKIQSKIIVE